MYQSITSLTIPPPEQNPGQKESSKPRPQGLKNELKTHPLGHFPELFTVKTRKNETEIM